MNTLKMVISSERINARRNSQLAGMTKSSPLFNRGEVPRFMSNQRATATAVINDLIRKV